MKIKIESTPAGVTVELTTDSAKKPMRQTFTKQDIQALIKLLETAAKADMLRIEYET